MKTFDENKDKEIDYSQVDWLKFKSDSFKKFIAHHEAIEPQEEQSHIEVTKVYPNGSKETARVIDKPKVEGKEAWDEYEDCFYLVPLTLDERKEKLRAKRQTECFKLVDRSQFWYDSLSESEKTELKEWYTKWLHVTDTFEIPTKPTWLEERI